MNTAADWLRWLLWEDVWRGGRLAGWLGLVLLLGGVAVLVWLVSSSRRQLCGRVVRAGTVVGRSSLRLWRRCTACRIGRQRCRG